MKGFLFYLFFWLVTSVAQAQGLVGPAASGDFNGLYPTLKSVFLPLAGLYLLCQLVVTAIQLLTAYLLKRQIISATVPESIIEHLLPSPQHERNSVVRRIALLSTTGGGLVLSNWVLPWGMNSIIILLFSTTLGYVIYYLYLLRQTK